MKVSGLYLVLVDLEADIHGFQWSLLDGNIAQSVGDKHQLEMPEKTDVCAHKCRASTISNTSFVENLGHQVHIFCGEFGHQVIQFWIIGN